MSDLSVTADGFSATYRTLPRDAAGKEPAPSPGEDGQGAPESRSDPNTKVKPPTKTKPQPAEKPEAAPETQAMPEAPGECDKVKEVLQRWLLFWGTWV